MMHEVPHKRAKKGETGGEQGGESEFQLKVVWEWMGSARMGTDNWELGRKQDSGEGVYIWSEGVASSGDVVRTLEDVVETAGRS